MWVSCLGPPRPCRLPILIANGPPPPIRSPLTVSITSRPSRYPAVSNNTTVRSDSNSNNPTPEQKQEEGREISGSDVLWALQRAAAQKKKLKKKKKKQKEPSPTASHMEKKNVDYSNVKPLQIKREWGIKLDELDKRLKQLDETP